MVEHCSPFEAADANFERLYDAYFGEAFSNDPLHKRVMHTVFRYGVLQGLGLFTMEGDNAGDHETAE